MKNGLIDLVREWATKEGWNVSEALHDAKLWLEATDPAPEDEKNSLIEWYEETLHQGWEGKYTMNLNYGCIFEENGTRYLYTYSQELVNLDAGEVVTPPDGQLEWSKEDIYAQFTIEKVHDQIKLVPLLDKL
jgi:hypothetical protein